jgi:hypothetical protein
MKKKTEITTTMSEMNLLRTFIEERFNLDIMNRDRKRDTVDARMIFSKILRENGHTFSNIARYLNKDHTTILHYTEQCMFVLKNDLRLMSIYVDCKGKFEENITPLTYYNTSDLIKETISLRNEIDKLILENNKLKENRYERLNDIMNLINARTPEGHENLIKRKINEFFNGLWGD